MFASPSTFLRMRETFLTARASRGYLPFDTSADQK